MDHRIRGQTTYWSCTWIFNFFAIVAWLVSAMKQHTPDGACAIDLINISFPATDNNSFPMKPLIQRLEKNTSFQSGQTFYHIFFTKNDQITMKRREII